MFLTPHKGPFYDYYAFVPVTNQILLIIKIEENSSNCFFVSIKFRKEKSHIITCYFNSDAFMLLMATAKDIKTC